MTVISIPKILRDKLTDEGADAFVEILNRVEDRTQKAVLEIAEERSEKRLGQIESKIETKIETRISQAETRLIRWMFGLIIGQFWATIGAMIGIFFTFLKK